MSDVAAVQEIASSPVVSTPSKRSAASKKATSKKARAKPAHPPTSEMVSGAIKGLKERGGSSLQAIKKYISANYKVDAEKLSPFIKKYLKAAVISGTLMQTKGKGATGSFKLAVTSTTKSVPKESISDVKKAATVKKISKTKKATDSTNDKKLEINSTDKAKRRVKAVKKTVVMKTPALKSPRKMKKTTKVSVKKIKTPKPKITRKSVSAPKKSTKKR